jgi:hypothetical protein
MTMINGRIAYDGAVAATAAKPAQLGTATR